jgi:hypothetical protein
MIYLTYFESQQCNINQPLFKYGVHGSVVGKALPYKPDGCGFEERWGEWIFLIYLILPAALGPGVYSASNRNEYQKQKNYVLGELSAAGA